MMIAAHQPNFLPWLGFFDKIRRSDAFIVMDHVQFARRNYQNRTRLFLGRKVGWLTVPVVQDGREERIIEKLIHNDEEARLGWGPRAYLTIEQAYRKAPHFGHYAPALKSVFARRWERLIDLNVSLLRFSLDALEIRTPLVFSSQLGLSSQKSDLILDMCRAMKADSYLAGSGGSREYLNTAAFSAKGVEVRWQEFRHPDYPQQHSPQSHVHGLSVLDMLFNCGPRSAALLAGGTQTLPGSVNPPSP